MDRRTRKTVSSLKLALTSLLKEKEIEKISIIELTSLANINRKTFYLHYDSVDEVFEDIKNTLVNNIKNRLVTSKFAKENINKIIYDLFNVIIDDECVYHILKESKYNLQIYDEVKRVLIDELSKISTLKQLNIRYHVYGCVGVFKDLIDNNYQSYNLNTLSNLLKDLILQ